MSETSPSQESEEEDSDEKEVFEEKEVVVKDTVQLPTNRRATRSSLARVRSPSPLSFPTSYKMAGFNSNL